MRQVWSQALDGHSDLNDDWHSPAPGDAPDFHGACAAALDAFRAADNPADDQLVADLEAMVERTKGEIERLSAHLATLS
jgi:hypothetical protein